MTAPFTEDEAATSILAVLGTSGWEGSVLARAFLVMRGGGDDEAIARSLFESPSFTLTRARSLIPAMRSAGFLALIPQRSKTGSAENPITKLFPATITEQRFVEVLDALCERCKGLAYSDERESGHGYVDFRLRQAGIELPMNVKNAGTRFERAAELVGIEPDDCIPIPAYKAYGAIEMDPSLVYAVAVDYNLVRVLDENLPPLLSRDEQVVWSLLQAKGGGRLRSAEDALVFSAVRKHWEALRARVSNKPFHAVSARKAIRVLQTKPKRTPGIGLRAWGTGAAAEVNVHLSLSGDTMGWEEVERRIVAGGLQSVVDAVNRRREETVYDPEI